jgi:hypothetical protein
LQRHATRQAKRLTCCLILTNTRIYFHSLRSVGDPGLRELPERLDAVEGQMVCVMRSMCFFSECRPYSGDDVLSLELPVGILETMLADIWTVRDNFVFVPVSQI